MVGASNLDTYIEVQDKFGIKVGTWATKLNPGKAGCKFCPGVSLDFRKGRCQLTTHSESQRHRNKIKDNKETQPTMEEVLAGRTDRNEEKEELKKKVGDLEIALSQYISRHNHPPLAAECLSGILKKYITDSEIVGKLQLGREKARYLIEFGISETYEEETIQMMRDCDSFGAALDESEVNKKSEMEVVARVSHPEDGLETRHYKCIDLEAGDAATITDTLLDNLVDDKIDYKAKLISVDSDGCSTMMGHKSGRVNLIYAAT